MDPYKQRLLKEYTDNFSRWYKLREFVNGTDAPKLGVNQFSLLKRQCQHMGRYLDVLHSRLITE